MSSVVENLRLAQIRIDGGTQPRMSLNEATVADYQEALIEGAKMPPVTVFHDGVDYWLADGFHRFFAHKNIGALDIQAEVRKGTKRDAILHSVGANALHGLRRTNEDKRKAVLKLLEDAEWSKWPDTEIARACGVGRHFVRNMRSEVTCTLSTSDDDQRPVYRKYINKHGQEALMNVARIGSTKKRIQTLSEADELLLSLAPTPCVYVLHSNGRCKIGWSRYPKSRIRDLVCHNPEATLVAVAEGGVKEERAIHAALECERDVGEWFIVGQNEVLDALKALGIPYTTKHGTEAVMNTANIGKKKADAQAAPAPKKRPARTLEAAPLPEEQMDADDELAEAHHTIADLAAEVDQLRDQLAIKHMDASEAEKQHAAGTIADLRRQVKALEEENATLKVSRDTYMQKCAEMQKQINYWRREAEKRAAA